MSRVRYATVLTAAAVAIAAGASGITYAATTTPPQVVYGCVNSHGVLKLVANGRCAAGYSKVGINRAGVRGPRGPKGLTGATGPGVRTAYVTSTTEDGNNATISVAAMQLEVYLVCTTGQFGQAGLYIINDDLAGSDFTVVGDVLVQRADGSASLAHHGTSHDVPDGLSAVDIVEPGSEPVAVEFQALASPNAGTVRMRAHVTVRRDGLTRVLRFYLDQNPTKCRTWAAVVPAS